jgi:hypothetical protein
MSSVLENFALLYSHPADWTDERFVNVFSILHYFGVEVSDVPGERKMSRVCQRFTRLGHFPLPGLLASVGPDAVYGVTSTCVPLFKITST